MFLIHKRNVMENGCEHMSTRVENTRRVQKDLSSFRRRVLGIVWALKDGVLCYPDQLNKNNKLIDFAFDFSSFSNRVFSEILPDV